MIRAGQHPEQAGVGCGMVMGSKGSICACGGDWGSAEEAGKSARNLHQAWGEGTPEFPGMGENSNFPESL